MRRRCRASAASCATACQPRDHQGRRRRLRWRQGSWRPMPVSSRLQGPGHACNRQWRHVRQDQCRELSRRRIDRQWYLPLQWSGRDVGRDLSARIHQRQMRAETLPGADAMARGQMRRVDGRFARFGAGAGQQACEGDCKANRRRRGRPSSALPTRYGAHTQWLRGRSPLPSAHRCPA
jgi:hypothetical protein